MKEKNDKIALLAKTDLNSIEVLIFQALIDSNIIQYEFDDMKDEIVNLKT